MSLNTQILTKAIQDILDNIPEDTYELNKYIVDSTEYIEGATENLSDIQSNTTNLVSAVNEYNRVQNNVKQVLDQLGSYM